jgi:hypothetical protein
MTSSSYDAAFIGTYPAQSTVAGDAIAWADERGETYQCGVTAVAPTKQRFREDAGMARLPKSWSRESFKSIGGRARVEPVVIAFWPSAMHLEELDARNNLKALVVLPWADENEIAAWRSARRAIDLCGDYRWEPPKIADPVVRVAMEHLTVAVDLSSRLTHPSEKARAIHTLQILNDRGHQYDAHELLAWAWCNGWSAAGARLLSQYAKSVVAGKAYRTSRSPLRDDIIRRWRSEAASG